MSEFFKTPLFNADYIDKELLNIDSEHQKNLKKDINKLYTIFRTYAQSPYNKFSTGNLQTLKIWPEAKNISVRAEMIQFYNNFYSSNLMTAAIIGKEDIDSLTKVAIDNLSGIQNKHVTRPNFSGQNYLREPKASDQQQGKIILIEPVKDIRILRIIMKMPFLSDQEHLYNPLPKIIHHLIGNEGEGTLLALLKKENLAINLMAGSDITSNGGPIFSQVSMTLTENGLKNYETIILYYFQFIKLMKNNLPFQESLWTEQKKIKKMDFTFSSKFTDVGSLVKTISKTLHKSYFRSNPGKIYANYLDGYNKYDDKVKHLIEKILNEFKLENMFCFLSAKEFSKNWPEDVEKKTETLYNTTYGEGKFSDHLISKIIGVENNSNNLTIHEDLFLPSENQFIPDDFKVYYDSDSDFTDLGIVNYGMNNETENANVTDVVLPRARNPNWPILYKRNQNAIMFLKPFINNPPPKLQDIKPQPKMHATIKLVTFKDKFDMEEYFVRKVISLTLSDDINKLTYTAALAGLSCKASVTFGHITISTDGFSQNQGKLVLKVLDRIKNLENKIKQEKIDIYADIILKNLNNGKKKASYKMALDLFDKISFKNARPSQMYIDFLTLEKDKFNETAVRRYFREELIQNISFLKGYIGGNILAGQAKNMTDDCLKWAFDNGALEMDPSRQLSYIPEEEKPEESEEGSNEYQATYLPMTDQTIFSINSTTQVSNALLLFIQTEIKTIESYSINYLFNSMLKSSFFSDIRSRQSLGYVVHIGPYRKGNRVGTMIVIQGGYEPRYMHYRALEFMIYKIDTVLKSYDNEPDKFLNFKNSMANSINPKIKTQSQLDSGIWDEIRNSRFDFDIKERTADYINSQELSLSKIEEYYKEQLLKSKAHACVYVKGVNADFNGYGFKELSEQIEKVDVLLQEEPVVSQQRRTKILPMIENYNIISAYENDESELAAYKENRTAIDHSSHNFETMDYYGISFDDKEISENGVGDS